MAAAGLVAHNLLSLPLSPHAPERVGPLFVYAALLVCFVSAYSAAPRVAMLAWVMLNLVAGGILTVLPLPFPPFVPEQTAEHYGAHII